MTEQLRPDRGRHAAVCRSVQVSAPSEHGKAPSVVIGFELTDPNDPDVGYHLSYFGSLSDAAIEHTVKALGNCGWTGDDLSELPELAEAGQLAEPVDLVVDHEEHPIGSGKWKVKIRWVNRPGGGGKIKLERPVEGDDLKKLGSAMKSAIRASRGVSSAPRSTASRQPSRGRDGVPPPRDDDRGPPSRGRGGSMDDDLPW